MLCNVPLSKIGVLAMKEENKRYGFIVLTSKKKMFYMAQNRLAIGYTIIYCSDVKEKFLLRHWHRNKCSWSILIAVGRVKRGNCLSTSQSRGSALFLGFTIQSHFPMDFLPKIGIQIPLYSSIIDQVYCWLKTASDGISQHELNIL